MKTYVAGVDISYDLTTYAIVDLRGAIIAKDSFITNDYPNVNDFVAHLTECLVMFFEDHCGYDRIRSVGVCPAVTLSPAVLSTRPTCSGREKYPLQPFCATA